MWASILALAFILILSLWSVSNLSWLRSQFTTHFGPDEYSDLDINQLKISKIVEIQDYHPNLQFSAWRCDRQAMACHFTNISYQNGQWFLLVPSLSLEERAAISALLVNPGIGSPANQFYIDDWTFMDVDLDIFRSIVESNATIANDGVSLSTKEFVQAIRKARDLLFVEIASHPNIKYTPIYMHSVSNSSQSNVHRVPNLSVIVNPLWPTNLFRVMYSAAMTLFTLCKFGIEMELIQPRFILLDDQFSPETGLTGIFDMLRFSNTKIASFTGEDGTLVENDSSIWLWTELNDANKTIKFDQLVFGLSRHGLLDETIMSRDLSQLNDKRKAFTQLAKMIRSHLGIDSSSNLNHTRTPRRAMLIERADPYRSILNLDKVEAALGEFPNIEVNRCCLESLSLRQQIRRASQTDILIGMHGAGLTHMLFQSPGSLIVELFPYGFRKETYRDMARILGHDYVSWQAPRPNLCTTTLANISVEIETKVDWNNQTSKDFWRNQSVLVNVNELLSHIRPYFRNALNVDPLDAFLIYMPWEQFNNQIVALKSACAVALYTNRTLVLPPIGHRRSDIPNTAIEYHGNNMRVFDPLHYEWQPISRYFEQDNLSQLPCRTIPFETFTNIYGHVRTIFMRNLGFSRGVTRSQVERYYYWIVRMNFDIVKTIGTQPQIYLRTQEQVKRFFSQFGGEKILALGVAFWIHSFDQELDYPLSGYFDMMKNSVYRAISASMQFHSDLVKMAENLITKHLGDAYGAIHWRRGDYQDKCRHGNAKEMTDRMKRSCYQSVSSLIARLRRIKYHPKVVYLATNDANKLPIAEQLSKYSGVKLVILDKVLAIERLECINTSPQSKGSAQQNYCVTLYHLNSVELSILDQIMCAKATWFIGNYYSSFTRTIVDLRQLNTNDKQQDLLTMNLGNSIFF